MSFDIGYVLFVWYEKIEVIVSFMIVVVVCCYFFSHNPFAVSHVFCRLMKLLTLRLHVVD